MGIIALQAAASAWREREVAPSEQVKKASLAVQYVACREMNAAIQDLAGLGFVLRSQWREALKVVSCDAGKGSPAADECRGQSLP